MRQELLLGTCRSPYDQDLLFIIRRLRNLYNSSETELHVLMNDTVLFEDGVPVLAVSMNQRPFLDHIVFLAHPTISQIQKLMNG